MEVLHSRRGMGKSMRPELGYVRLSENASVRGALGLPVERNLFFKADRPLSRCADQAQRLESIRA